MQLLLGCENESKCIKTKKKTFKSKMINFLKFLSLTGMVSCASVSQSSISGIRNLPHKPMALPWQKKKMSVYNQKLWLLVRPKREAPRAQHAQEENMLVHLQTSWKEQTGGPTQHCTALHLSQHKCYQAKPWDSNEQSENQGRGADPEPPLCCATWGKEV